MVGATRSPPLLIPLSLLAASVLASSGVGHPLGPPYLCFCLGGPARGACQPSGFRGGENAQFTLFSSGIKLPALELFALFALAFA